MPTRGIDSQTGRRRYHVIPVVPVNFSTVKFRDTLHNVDKAQYTAYYQADLRQDGRFYPIYEYTGGINGSLREVLAVSNTAINSSPFAKPTYHASERQAWLPTEMCDGFHWILVRRSESIGFRAKLMFWQSGLFGRSIGPQGS